MQPGALDDFILRRMLADAGMPDESALEVEAAWAVFKEFARVPLKTESDLLMIEWLMVGVWERQADGRGARVGERFHFSMIRQGQEGGDEEFIQIGCVFEYEPDEMLRGFGKNVSYWDEGEISPTLDDFFAQIEATGVIAALKGRTPIIRRIRCDTTG
ncbi:MAG: hypothetical protein CUN53_12285 [Phototrophicales bacterium]|nr:MAG: hypothetical protein CUN53_12285 [Phototrophicales bacterium]